MNQKIGESQIWPIKNVGLADVIVVSLWSVESNNSLVNAQIICVSPFLARL